MNTRSNADDRNGAKNLQSSLVGFMAGLELSFLTNSLAAIYLNEANDTLRKILPHLKHLDEWSIKRVQKWYTLQKVTHGYETNDTLEKKLIRTIPHLVRPHNVQNEQVKFIPSEKIQALTQIFQKDIEYGLKNFLEILARAIVDSKLNRFLKISQCESISRKR